MIIKAVSDQSIFFCPIQVSVKVKEDDDDQLGNTVDGNGNSAKTNARRRIPAVERAKKVEEAQQLVKNTIEWS